MGDRVGQQGDLLLALLDLPYRTELLPAAKEQAEQAQHPDQTVTADQRVAFTTFSEQHRIDRNSRTHTSADIAQFVAVFGMALQAILLREHRLHVAKIGLAVRHHVERLPLLAASPESLKRLPFPRICLIDRIDRLQAGNMPAQLAAAADHVLVHRRTT